MGVSTNAITFVGREFKNEQEALVYFKSKIKLTEDDLLDLQNSHPQLHYWLEDHKKKGFPEGGLYSRFTGDENCGYYIGYHVYNSNPDKMQKNIAKASEDWKNMFKEKAQVIQAVLYT